MGPGSRVVGAGVGGGVVIAGFVVVRGAGTEGSLAVGRSSAADPAVDAATVEIERFALFDRSAVDGDAPTAVGNGAAERTAGTHVVSTPTTAATTAPPAI
jgi:hypothetical protein